MKQQYLQEAQNLRFASEQMEKITIKTESPSNIALVKYWGKRPIQLPQNPSISFTLTASKTEMEISYLYEKNKKEDSVKLYFEDQLNPAFGKKIQKYLKSIEPFLPFLKWFKLEIKSNNTFPHSSGIASSASSMSALALNLCLLERKLFGTLQKEEDFLAKASFLARLASGSASRSVYNGFTIWGESKFVEQSNDALAIPLPFEINKKYKALQDRILITAAGAKIVSSSQGHQLMEVHPYKEVRYEQAKRNIGLLKESLISGEWSKFSAIVEEEAMSLHALMINSENPYTLMNENTWNIIYAIRKMREENDLEVTFTLDAGPNVHLIFPENIAAKVDTLINKNLIGFCMENNVIKDFINTTP